MSRHRFEVYLDKVFGFSNLVGDLPEGRQFPQHPWHKVFNAIFLGAAMQRPSLLQFQAECRTGALAKRIGPIVTTPSAMRWNVSRPNPSSR